RGGVWMSEVSMPRAGTDTNGGVEARGRSRELAVAVLCLIAGALALAAPLLWLVGAERTFADTLAFAAWAWLLFGLPLLAVLVVGGVRAARHGREPRLLGAFQWFAVGLAVGVVLLEAPRLLS